MKKLLFLMLFTMSAYSADVTDDIFGYDGSFWKARSLAEAGISDDAHVHSGGLDNVVEDLTPQLGGNLDVNGKQIISEGLEDIVLVPSDTSTGSDVKVILSGFAGDTKFRVQNDALLDRFVVTNGGVVTTQGDVNGRNIASDGTVQDNHIADSTIHFAEASISITESQISDLSHTVNTNAQTICATATDVLQGDGTCVANAGGGGMSDLVDDLTPELGGDLSVNDNDIVAGTNANVFVKLGSGGDFQINDSIDAVKFKVTDVGTVATYNTFYANQGISMEYSTLDKIAPDVYDSGWNANETAPSKNDIYDKIVTLPEITGTPANNQLSVWTDANTLEGESELTYDGSTLAIENTSVIAFTATNTGAGGAGIIGYSDTGALMSDNARLGFYLLGGGTGAGTFNAAGIQGYTTQAWSAGRGSELRFEITADGAFSRSSGMVLGNDASLAVVGTVTGSNLSGTNTGDQTITLTGDVTGTGTGSFATSIASGVVGPTELEATAVTAGSYTATDITVDADGRITAASNGSSGGGLTYTEHTANANLTIGTTNYFKSGTLTMTLPLLSTTTDGDVIEGYITGSDHTVIVNHHASDSAGAEHWTGYAQGDHYVFRVVDAAWHVEREKTTVRGWLAKTADQTINSIGTSIHTSNYSVEENIGDWWDSATDNRFEIAFDSVVQFFSVVQVNSRDLGTVVAINGTVQTDHATGSRYMESMQGAELFRGKVTSGDYMEIVGTYSSSGNDIMGDAAKDETRVYWEVIERIR